MSDVKMEILPPPTEEEGQGQGPEPTEEKAPKELNVEQKNEVLTWDPACKVEITGEQFGILNMVIKQLTSKAPIFSLDDFLTQSQHLNMLLSAMSACEQVVAKMKEQGIATVKQ